MTCLFQQFVFFQPLPDSTNNFKMNCLRNPIAVLLALLVRLASPNAWIKQQRSLGTSALTQSLPFLTQIKAIY